MNRSLTPISELERRLSELAATFESLPAVSVDSNKTLTQMSSNASLGVLTAFDTVLEGLRLEASLLQSEDSPFTQRRRQKERERAQRLAEARALAEAQIERRYREKELEELKAQRAAAEMEQSAKESSTRAHDDFPSSNATKVVHHEDPIASAKSESEDWESSFDYTVARTAELPPQDESELSLSPDDSIFMDLPSTPPPILNTIKDLKESLPPNRATQVTKPPRPQAINTESVNHQQLISLLKGLLPARPRSDEAPQKYIGASLSQENAYSAPLMFSWEIKTEVVWRELDETKILEELEGLTSLSLAPRAFSPAQPVPRRTVSLRLKSTEDASSIQAIPEEEEFNLSDFEETRDPELKEMHETYRALEAQVEEFNFESGEHLNFDRLNEPSLDAPKEQLISDEGAVQEEDEETDFATLDPELPIINDPFDMIDDLDFGDSGGGRDFNWEGDTPTNVFGDEPTPTDVFGDEASRAGDMRPDGEESHQTSNRGLFSRFFGRKQ